MLRIGVGLARGGLGDFRFEFALWCVWVVGVIINSVGISYSLILFCVACCV